MENDVPTPTLPDLDEHDVAALEALLIRQIRAQDATARDREVVAVINARIAENAKITGGIYQALSSVYGFVEPEDEANNKWDLVREAIGVERYARALALARGDPPPPLLAKMGDDGSPSKIAADDAGVEDPAPAGAIKRPIPIRAAILEYLAAAGDRGVKAAEVRQHLLAARGITVHEKTPGMTLYRLLKDGLARREGRTWYAAQTTTRNENEAPSGNTAGASEAGGAATPPNESQSVEDLIG